MKRGYRSFTNRFNVYVGRRELILCASVVSFRPAARRTYSGEIVYILYIR